MASKKAVDIINKPRYTVLLLLFFIAAGLAGNTIHFSIINAHFIFGSIFAMLALQFLGYKQGVLAAAIISSYTYIAWNHPWGILTMTTEAIVVGWIIRHRKMSMLAADTLYWFFIGIPIGFLGFHVISAFPVGNSLFLLTKQAINGITNALVARLIFSLLMLFGKSKASPVSFRELVANLLAFFVLCTAWIILAFDSTTDFTGTDRDIRTRLARTSLQASGSLKNWIEDRKLTLVHLAELAKTIAPEQMQLHFEQLHAADNNFLRIIQLDRNAIAVAYMPLVDRLGHPNLGKNFADRPYIPVLKEQREPMLSEVMESRFGNQEPVVIMLVPVITGNTYNGAIGGILNFAKIAALLANSAPGIDLQYTLVDKNGNVILTNRTDQTVMKAFTRGKGSLDRIDDTLAQWIPALPPNISSIELWGKSSYVAESPVGRAAEWKLILEQPVVQFQQTLYNNYSGKFFVLFAILLVSLLLAEFLSRRIMKTTEHLSRLTRDLPARLGSDRQIAWPESTILETRALVENFRKMTDSLADQFDAIEQMNASLETLVAQRTADLQKSEAQLSAAVQMARLGYWEYDADRDSFTFNDQFYSIFRTTALQVGAYTLPPAAYIEHFIHPGDAAVMAEEIRNAVNTGDPGYNRQLEHRMLYADGTVGYILVRFSIIKDSSNRTIRIYGVNQDITERKQAEEQITQSLREKETLLRELYHRTKNNMQVIRSMLVLQAASRGNKEISEFTREIEQKIMAMALVHQKLYQSKDLSRIDLKEYLSELAHLLIQSYAVTAQGIALDMELERIPILIDTAIPCGLVFNELMSNALKYAFPGKHTGTITVKMKRAGEGVIELYYADNGIGVPGNFDIRAQSTLGLQTMIALVEQQLKGEISCRNEQGLAYTIRFSDNLYSQRI